MSVTRSHVLLIPHLADKRLGVLGKTAMRPRWYQFTDEQAATYTRAVEALVAKSVDEESADEMVKRCVVSLLQGERVPEGAPRIFQVLDVAFPAVSREQFFGELPVHGCPRGTLRSLVFVMAKNGERRMVRLDLDPYQSDVITQAIGAVAKLPGISRDDAWEQCTRMAGRLISGAPVPASLTHVGARLTEAFAEVDPDVLPAATDEDLRLCHFRDPQ